MTHILNLHKWRMPLICAAVAAVMLIAVGEGLTSRRTVTTAAAADEVILPIIMYHGILTDPARQGQYILSPTQFEHDLQYIRDAGYTTVTVADLIAYVDDGTPLPDKPIMLTFDDGYYNNYLYAYPLLKAYSMKAVISPVCQWSQHYSDTPSQADHAIYSHITWEEMREMVASGLVEIQNHSYDMHYATAGRRKGTLKMAGETDDDYTRALTQDITTAQRHLTDFAGVTPTAFVYPYGAVCAEARAIIRALGFRASFTCEAKQNRITRTADCLYNLGRYLRPAGQDSAAYFRPILVN